MKFVVLFAAASVMFPWNASATVIYDESVDGPLSNIPSSPTLLNLGVGSNDLIGSIGPELSDTDYFTFTLGGTQTLDSIIVASYDDPAAPNVSRFEIFNGAIAGSPGAGFITSGFGDPSLSGVNSTILVGGDLLLGNGPLGPNATFTIRLQESDGTVNYALTLNTRDSQIPEPTTVALMGLGLAGVGFARKRRLT